MSIRSLFPKIVQKCLPDPELKKLGSSPAVDGSLDSFKYNNVVAFIAAAASFFDGCRVVAIACKLFFADAACMLF